MLYFLWKARSFQPSVVHTEYRSFHFLLKVKVLVAQSCPTLCDSMDCSLPGSSVHGIHRARILEWLPCPSPGHLPNPGMEPGSPHCRQILLTTWAIREALLLCSTVPLAVLCSPRGSGGLCNLLTANLVRRALMKLSESLKCAPWNLGTLKIGSWLLWESESGLWEEAVLRLTCTIRVYWGRECLRVSCRQMWPCRREGQGRVFLSPG